MATKQMKTIQFPNSDDVYEINDATARSSVASLQQAVEDVQEDVASLQETVGGSQELATHTANGLMSSADKVKLDELNESHIRGLNVLCVGDSITFGQGMTTATRWANVMATQHNWNLTVKAQGGISMSNYYYRENEQSENGIVSKIDYITNMNPKPDLVIVWGGHNDTSYRHSPLGDFEDVQTQDTKGALATYADRYSFCGSIRYISEVVHTYAPEATLVILTREWVNATPSTLQVPSGTTDTNDMFDKVIMENGWRFGYIPINMSLCGITPYTKNSKTGDGIHPNEAGTRLIVKYLSSELNKIYYIYGIQSIAVTGVSLNKNSTTLVAGGTEQLTATIAPQDATNQAINWISSNSSVATVNNGLVTAVSTGSATITAQTVDGNYSASCSVTVSAQTVAVTGISLSPSTLELTIGASAVITPTITPSNATNQTIVWTSSDDQTIDVAQQNGHITALNVGTGTVTATTQDGNYTATCSITINALQNYYVLESLNSLTHDQWQNGSYLGTQYYAFDGTSSKEQLTGKTIKKVWIKTASNFTNTSGTVQLYDVPLTGNGGTASAPSDWTLIEEKEFTNLTASMPLEFALTNSHVVQSGHTVGIHVTKNKMIGTFNNTQISVKLDCHYFADASATTSSSASTNAFDFFIEA